MVSAVESRDPTPKISRLVASLQRKGVSLWSENGELRFRAPRGVMTQQELEQLRGARSDLLAFLEARMEDEVGTPARPPRRSLHSAPLTFAQWAHWNLHRLHERRCIRLVGTTTRLSGALDLDALRGSAAHLVSRHHALRTRIVLTDGRPTQFVSESGECSVPLQDLRHLGTQDRDAEIERQVEGLMQPIDVLADPLLEMRLLRLADREHLLIVLMDHLIADGFSMNIFLQELFVAYAQTKRGTPVTLPEIATQYPAYANWQSQVLRARLSGSGTQQWRERLLECGRTRLAPAHGIRTATQSGWGTVPLYIGAELRTQLADLCRRNRTSLVIGAFTAYAALVLRWCGVSKTVIQYQSNCRVSPEIQNTMGLFTSTLYVRVDIHEDDDFLQLMSRVRADYCAAHEHMDFAYLAAQDPRPGFTRNTVFNWSPLGSPLDASRFGDAGLGVVPAAVRFTEPMLRNIGMDNEPQLTLHDDGEQIPGNLYFARDQYSTEMMERFARSYLAVLRTLVSNPNQPLAGLALA